MDGYAAAPIWKAAPRAPEANVVGMTGMMCTPYIFFLLEINSMLTGYG